MLRERSRKGLSKANGADGVDLKHERSELPGRESLRGAPPRTRASVLHRRERQLTAPRREETAEALRRGSCLWEGNGV